MSPEPVRIPSIPALWSIHGNVQSRYNLHSSLLTSLAGERQPPCRNHGIAPSTKHKALPLESREENQGMLCTCRSPTLGCPVLPSSTQLLLGSSIHHKGGGIFSSALSCLLMQSLGSSYSNSLDSSPLFQDITMKSSLFWDMFENRAMNLRKILLIML